MDDKPFRLRRAIPLALCIAMLSACGVSAPKPRSLPAPDPVIVTRTELVRICPAELLATSPARPAVPADAVLSGNPSGMEWLVQSQAYTALIEDRLSDAAAQCAEVEQ